MNSDLSELSPTEFLSFLKFLEDDGNYACETSPLVGDVLRVLGVSVSIGEVDEFSARKLGVKSRLFGLVVPEKLAFIIPIKKTVIISQEFIGIRFFLANEFITLLFSLPPGVATDVVSSKGSFISTILDTDLNEDIKKESVQPLIVEKQGKLLWANLISKDRLLKA